MACSPTDKFFNYLQIQEWKTNIRIYSFPLSKEYEQVLVYEIAPYTALDIDFDAI